MTDEPQQPQEQQAETPQQQGVIWSSPNQQVVREDQSGAGYPIEQGPDPQEQQETAEQLAAVEQQQQVEGSPSLEGGPNLDQMTKDELLVYGQQLGISPMNASMSKEEIRTAIDQHRG
jgi:hypothetical protein